MLNGLTSGTTYHYRVRSRDTSGNLAMSADQAFSTTAPGECPCSMWPLTATPAVPSQTDSSAVELGMRFRSDQDGLITGVRFYKGAANTGVHVVKLWSNNGTPLATATFEFESATGWQEVAFPTPVRSRPTRHTWRRTSRRTVDTRYAGGLHQPSNSPPLHALRDGFDGRSVSTATARADFRRRRSASNYWVDVVFVIVPDTTGPAITNIGAAAGVDGGDGGVDNQRAG